MKFDTTPYFYWDILLTIATCKYMYYEMMLIDDMLWFKMFYDSMTYMYILLPFMRTCITYIIVWSNEVSIKWECWDNDQTRLLCLYMCLSIYSKCLRSRPSLCNRMFDWAMIVCCCCVRVSYLTLSVREGNRLCRCLLFSPNLCTIKMC